VTVRPLGDSDIEQVWRLSQLAFGYRTETPPAELRDMYGVDGPDGRLLAIARVRAYEQLWGGRRVPMGGIASVAVHPDGRGQGLASTLMRGLLPVMRDAGLPVSTLFPTGVGIYRPVGWEVVGSLDDTRIATRDLRPRRPSTNVRTRSAGPGDTAAIAALYAGLSTNGLLTREGPEFPKGVEAVLEHDIVTLAETDDGAVVGFATCSRGNGYREGSELRLWDFVATSPDASAALRASLASWSTVASTVLWRGPTVELGLQLGSGPPPPVTNQPWMLRIVDAPAAIAARGFPMGVTAELSFVLDDPDVPEHAGAWRLRIAEGNGTLERRDDAAALPRLHVRGLALAYASAADNGVLLRAGLLDRSIAGLDLAFAGQPPQILDYF
jgi:predicted acetyltransferase